MTNKYKKLEIVYQGLKRASHHRILKKLQYKSIKIYTDEATREALRRLENQIQNGGQKD